jgi:hypothetical protein
LAAIRIQRLRLVHQTIEDTLEIPVKVASPTPIKANSKATQTGAERASVATRTVTITATAPAKKTFTSHFPQTRRLFDDVGTIPE